MGYIKFKKNSKRIEIREIPKKTRLGLSAIIRECFRNIKKEK